MTMVNSGLKGLNLSTEWVTQKKHVCENVSSRSFFNLYMSVLQYNKCDNLWDRAI